jgi:hypothetical protein
MPAEYRLRLHEHEGEGEVAAPGAERARVTFSNARGAARTVPAQGDVQLLPEQQDLDGLILLAADEGPG